MPLFSFGQNLQILVQDAETKTPLPYANIYFKKSGLGASTNRGGIATLAIDKLLGQDTFVVSYIGYDLEELAFQKQSANKPLIINLNSSAETLSEVVIEYIKPPKPEKIIRKAIRNTDENYSTQALIHEVLYRETLRENDQYIQLNEAITKTYYTAYPQKRLDGSIWKDWYYDESYAFNVDGNRYFFPLLKDFNTKEDQQIVMASRHSKNWSEYGIESILIGDPLLLFALDKIKYRYDFLNPAILNRYEFKHQEAELINGEDCYVISFYPKENKRRFRIDQSRKNRNAIYIGRMYITKATFAVTKFEYKLAVERDFGFFEKKMPLDYQVEMNYKKQDGFYTIDQILFTETRKVDQKANGESVLHTATKALFVLNTETEAVSPVIDSLRFKSTRFSAIQFYKKNYNPDYWNTLQLPQKMHLAKEIKIDLEAKEPLTEQFNHFKKEEKENLPAPKAAREYFAFDYHDVKVVDSLHWMAFPEKADQFKQYLTAENKYAKNELIVDQDYQKKLFDELNTFYPKPKDTTRTIHPETFFFKEDSLGNDLFCYQIDSVKSVLVLNLSTFKDQNRGALIKNLSANPEKNHLLVQYQVLDSYGDKAKVYPFGSNEAIDSITNIYSLEWFTESSILYAKTGETARAGQLWYHQVGKAQEELIYEEKDPTFDVEVIQEGPQYFCTVQSKTENEIYQILPTANLPKLALLKARKKGVMNTIKETDGFYLLENDESEGSSLKYASLDDPSTFQTIVAANKDQYIVDFMPLKNHLIGLIYENAIPQLYYLEQGATKWKNFDFKLGIGDYYLIDNQKEPSNTFNFSFSSPSVPPITYQFDFGTQKLKLISKRKVKDESFQKYTSTKQLWAKSHDGEKVPITLIRNVAATGAKEVLILKTYGAYGALTTPYFDAQDATLLAQGYTIAYAHVRGEGILGPQWYEAGRVLNKQNSIKDYVACAEYLIQKGYTNSENLVGYGNSAGGMIVGQAINERPDLFNTVILDHPYLDVLNTMMHDTLPLTVDEYKEWGNPQDKTVYNYIKAYSPYQNIKTQSYPNVLILGSYQDFQTPMWQIAKYTAKLRKHNQANTTILMLTDMQSGHLGNTSGKEWIKSFAQVHGFVKSKVID